MKIGARGLGLIKQFEGLRLDAYQDSAGVWTIGYGHTAAAGEPEPCAGMRISRGQAEAILVRHLGKYEAAVLSATTRPASQAQFDAMVSLCFNIGPASFSRSSVVRKFNAGDDAGSAEAFLAFDKAGGKALQGLARRRAAERRLFLSQGTTRAKWAIAGAGGTMGGTIAAAIAESFAGSSGHGVAAMLDWRGLVAIGAMIGIAAVITLVAMGEERRERLWDKVVGL